MAELKSLRERFYELVHKEVGENGHWIWLGRRMTDRWGPRVIFDLGRNRKGDNKIVIATRFAWEDVHGTPLDKKRLKRLCGNKLCVNPAHYTLQVNEPKDRHKLLALALNAGEKDLRRTAIRRHEKQAPYLAMHWAKGIAKELVRQRALLIELCEATNTLLRSLAESKATVDTAPANQVVTEPATPATPATNEPEPTGNGHKSLPPKAKTPLVDVFRSSVPGCVVSDTEERELLSVFDRAIELRLDDERGMTASVELFHAWLRRFADECSSGESAPTVSQFTLSSDRYALGDSSVLESSGPASDVAS